MRMDQAKRAVAECIKKGGGYEAAADWMGVSTTTLHNLQNQNMPDDPRDRPLAWLLRLDEFAGAPIMLQAIAVCQGFALTPVGIRETRDFRDAVLRISGTIGGLTSQCADALADDVIDQAEEKAIRETVGKAKSTLVDFEEHLNGACKNRGRS